MGGVEHKTDSLYNRTVRPLNGIETSKMLGVTGSLVDDSRENHSEIVEALSRRVQGAS